MTAVDVYRESLLVRGGELLETDVTPFDRVGIPVWSVVYLAPVAGSGIGYGSDTEAARTSAYGELVEGVRSGRTLAALHPRRSSYARLLAACDSALETVQDPRTLCLPAGTDWTEQTVLDWLPTTRRRDGATVWVPAELAASRGSDLAHVLDPPPPLTTVIGNGLGAGLDPERAVSHALLELLQRDGNGLRFRALDRGIRVDLDGLDDAASCAAVEALRAVGVEPIVKLATTEFGLANVFAVGRDDGRDDGGEALRVTACGEACHPDRDVAVRKALLELCSSRARKAFMHGSLARVRKLAGDTYLESYLDSLGPAPVEQEEARSLASMREWVGMGVEELTALHADTAFAVHGSVPFTGLPTRPATGSAQVLADVENRLSDAGMDVLVLDLSGDGAHAAKALVPGLEVETMSYGRIGERGVREALELDLPFVRVGPDPGGWSRVALTPTAEDAVGGPAWLDRAGVDRVVGALYPLYREPARHLVQL